MILRAPSVHLELINPMIFSVELDGHVVARQFEDSSFSFAELEGIRSLAYFNQRTSFAMTNEIFAENDLYVTASVHETPKLEGGLYCKGRVARHCYFLEELTEDWVVLTASRQIMSNLETEVPNRIAGLMVRMSVDESDMYGMLDLYEASQLQVH